MIEHPFDTVKVRLQTSTSPVGLVKLTRTLIQTEGFAALYKGLTPPLVASVLETACLFSVNGLLKNGIGDFLQYERGKQLPMAAEFFSGSITGLIVSFILTPAELVKCRLQIQNQALGAGKALYDGPIDCVVKSVRKDGWSIMFRGHTATMIREIPGTAAWFGSYEACLRVSAFVVAHHHFTGITALSLTLPIPSFLVLFEQLLTPGESNRDNVAAWKTIVAGAMGGVMYWAMLFPADTAKSMIQTQEERMSIGAAVKQLYQKGGIKYFYRGLTPTLLRAAPANAAVFGCYEISASLINDMLAATAEKEI